MDSYILPATTYQSPTRPARKHILNTIIEDDFSEQEEAGERGRRGRSCSPAEDSSSRSISPVPSLTSSISSYYMSPRRSQDFDELYDVSDSEWERELKKKTKRGSHSRFPSLIIPSPRLWPTIEKLQKGTLPPALPPKIPISPAVLSLLGQITCLSSAPPSLDGSLTSGENASSTTPSTPDISCPVDREEQWGAVAIKDSSTDDFETASQGSHALDPDTYWDHRPTIVSRDTDETLKAETVEVRPDSPLLGVVESSETYEDGVQLPEAAIETLRHLSIESISENVSVVDEEPLKEMQEVSQSQVANDAVNMTPASAASNYSFSQLSIPSPSDFFSSLNANARHTWCAFGSVPSSTISPSSTTAEHFYAAPWNTASPKIIQSTVEVDDNLTEGPPTARQLPCLPKTPTNATTLENLDATPESKISVLEIEAKEPQKDYDEDYEQEIKRSAESTKDRTSNWLAEQTAYMAALREANPVNKISIDTCPAGRRASRHVREDSLDSPMKKAVRFLESEATKAGSSSPRGKADPLFYQAFQHVATASSPKDSFVHQSARYDSLQAQRISLPKAHQAQLFGNYQTTSSTRIAPPRPISLFPGTGSAEETSEQAVFARVAKEQSALEQVSPSTWVLEATRYLNRGRLLNSPAHALLLADAKDASDAESRRVLDLGGQPHADWAWALALEFPHVKTYTATSDAHCKAAASVNPVKGPSNHRAVHVAKLWELPFPDAHFDAVSARSLHAQLHAHKAVGGGGGGADEYDLVLQEAMRVLKPGGLLEFFLLDSEIMHAGPLGTALGVEFSYNLRARGYDAAPTKPFLGRLRRAGFADIKRAWSVLPMGAVRREAVVLPETPPPHVSVYGELPREAVRGELGTGQDVGAVAGLVGSWVWESWVERLAREMGREGEVERVGRVVEEGRMNGAGWRCLSGWARKE